MWTDEEIEEILADEDFDISAIYAARYEGNSA